MAKLQLKDYWNFTRALQVAAYQMVSHKSTGFLPFQLLYNCDPLMPKEIIFTIYDSEKDYEVALSSYIQNILATN